MTETIEFIDFEPPASLTDQAAEKLARVSSESPSDSNTRAFLKKTQTGFEGRLQISSAAGTFLADEIGEDPAEVIEALSHKVRSQLETWKAERCLA